MSKADLQRYLLSGARDVQVDSTGLLSRRAVPQSKRNRLSLDLEFVTHDRPIKENKNVCEPSDKARSRRVTYVKRRSLNLEVSEQNEPKPGKCKDSISPNCPLELKEGCQIRGSDSSLTKANPRLLQLMEVTPQTYEEAQSLKKMLKRAVSGPDATFEDLKAYRAAMKKLRQAIEIVQAQEYQKTKFANQEFKSRKKSGSSSSSRYGSSLSTPSTSYLSALNRSTDRPGYGSDYTRTGCGSGSGTGANTYSSRYSRGNDGVLSLASRFGEPKSLDRAIPKSSALSASYSKPSTTLSSFKRTSTQATPSPTSPSTSKYDAERAKTTSKSTSYFSPKSNEATTVTSPSISTSLTNPKTSSSNFQKFSSCDRKSDNSIFSLPPKTSGLRNSNLTTDLSAHRELTTYGRTNSTLNEPTSLRRIPITSTLRSRTRELPFSPTLQETSSKYTRSSYVPRYSTQTSYEKTDYNSDAKSGYGSDYRSGYGSGYSSGSGAYQRSSWNRSSSFNKDIDTPSTYRTYSRENSFLNKDGNDSKTSKTNDNNSQNQTSGISTPHSPKSCESEKKQTEAISPNNKENSLLSKDDKDTKTSKTNDNNSQNQTSGISAPLSPKSCESEKKQSEAISPNNKENSLLSKDDKDTKTSKLNDNNSQNQTSEISSPLSPKSCDSSTSNSLPQETGVDNKKTERPSVFRIAIDKLSQETKENALKEKKSEAISPNAIKVLPALTLSDVKIKNKAPADFSSCSEDSDKETDKQKDVDNIKLQNCTDKMQEKKENILRKEMSPVETVTLKRPLRHLGAVPDLPIRRDRSPQGLIETPVFKKSDKYMTPMHELARSPSISSKFSKSKDIISLPSQNTNIPDSISQNNASISNKNKELSILKAKLPSQDKIDNNVKITSLVNDHKETLGIANKDCKKSTDIQPECDQNLRPKQVEKRELTNAKIQKGDNYLVKSLTEKSPEKEAIPNNASSAPKECDEPKESMEICKNEKKPPMVVDIEKSSSKSKSLSRGKTDSFKKSNTFRKTRERHSSHTSKSASMSSSESENESNNDRVIIGNDRVIIGSLSATRKEENLTGENIKLTNNSGTLVKVNSRGSKSRNSSRGSVQDKVISNSTSSVLSDKKQSVESDSVGNISQTTVDRGTITLGDPKMKIIMNGTLDNQKKSTLYQKKQKSVMSSSSSTSSDSSNESSESAGEEGYTFSLRKSKTIKKSRASLAKLSRSPPFNQSITLRDIGERTSPDGKENISRNSTYDNLAYDDKSTIEAGSEVACTFNLVIPYNKDDKSALSDKSVNAELSIYQLSDKSLTSSKSNVVSQNSRTSLLGNSTNEPINATVISKSNSAADVNFNNKQENERPVQPLQRKKTNAENNEEPATVEPGWEPFEWPDGSPVLSRKPYFKTQWDTETETEMEQLDWSDVSPSVSKVQMPQLEEETDDENWFQWPSSPELSRKISHPQNWNSGYDTQGDADDFEWPSSPDLPEMKEPGYISFMKDIDSIINEGNGQTSFLEMESKLGLASNEDKKKNEVGKPDEDDKKKAENDDKKKTDDDNENICQADNETGNKFEEKDREKKNNFVTTSLKERARKNLSLFAGKLANIDEILGSVLHLRKDAIEADREVEASEVKLHDAQQQRAEIHENIEEIDASAVIIRKKEKKEALKAELIKSVKEGLDDATLQVYKDGDYGTYLDLESSLSEQAGDIDGLTDSKRSAIVLRTQLSVRVHAIIEKLLNSEGRELRKSLFSLKQIFQDDKDLVHAFIQNDGLKCLVKVGTMEDQSYQTYILRALGQLMLYVDGMAGVSESPETLQWLYSLVSTRFRLLVKTALKLLLVFVEYSECNARTLVKTINAVCKAKGERPWSTIMKLLEGKDLPDTELQIYAMTLVNKALNGLSDQDSYYDQTDCLEEQGMELLIQKLLHSPNSDLDLLQQLTIYEAVLAYEDGDDVCRTRTIDPTIRQNLRYCNSEKEAKDRRKSKRHCQTPSPELEDQNANGELSSSDECREGHVTVINIKTGLPMDDLGGIKHFEAGVTPALRRRRERAERQKTFLKEQDSISDRKGAQSSEVGTVEEENRKNNEISWLLELMQAKKEGEVKDIAARIASLMDKENVDNNKKLPIELMSDSSVKDILKKISRGATLTVAEHEKLIRLGDVSGRIQKAKDGLLIKSHSKRDVPVSKTPEPPKKSENDLYWENLAKHLTRPLQLCDLDFTDLNEEDDKDVLDMTQEGIPPPPPPPPPSIYGKGSLPPIPPVENGIADEEDKSKNSPVSTQEAIPPPPPFEGSYGIPLAPPIGHNFGVALHSLDSKYHKTKKTIKLFWKEVRDDVIRNSDNMWVSIEAVKIDYQKLEHLFESKAKDITTKKQQDQKGVKEVIVLDSKRSNMINIGMTKLPPPRTIKTAILKMDSSIINREGIEKLLTTMLPTAEEKVMIQEAAMSNPELPLGSAEQFLMMLASISELPARLQLWLFKLDFENLEKEVAEPLMDLKQGIVDLQKNRTFAIVTSLLLSVGNFLNGSDCKGFQIDYLSKVPEVKDTVHKHSLLHHLCHMVIEKFPDSTDLYSELGAITRASKVDFEELQNTIEKMERDCKTSWDHLKAIAKHDGPTQMKLKMSEFLADAAERIIVLGIVYRRVLHRFQRFLLWFAMPANLVLESNPQTICLILSEFALEYRTCRERVLQQLEKKANHRERNKTRGKMITEMEKYRPRPKTKEEEADNDLRQLLTYSEVSDTETIRGKSAWRRTKEGKARSREENIMAELLMMGVDGIDDAVLDSLVKTATQAPTVRSTPRERKRSRNTERKSLRRTLRNGLSEEEKELVAKMTSKNI